MAAPLHRSDGSELTRTGVGERSVTAPGKVYVVDPDRALCSSIRWLVAHLEVEVICFGRGEALLESDDFEGPCCVVTDLNLPGMSGLDLVRELAKRPGDRIPVIVLATHSDIPSAVAALRAGAVDFFEKPFGGFALAERIEESLWPGGTPMPAPPAEGGR